MLGSVVQAKWITDDDGATYQQDVEIDGRTWEVRLSDDGDDEYRYTDSNETSGWATASEHTDNGHPPPLGARFQEQRRVDDVNDKAEDASRFVYESGDRERTWPLVIKQAHEFVVDMLKYLKIERDEQMAMLDRLVAEEFDKARRVGPAIQDSLKSENLDAAQRNILLEHFSTEQVGNMVSAKKMTEKQIGTLEAGLFYKRVYEHEQNLLTVKRASIRDLDEALDRLENKYGLQVEQEATMNDDIQDVVVKNYEGNDYTIGTAYYGDQRFVQERNALVGSGSAVYRHRGTGKEYVQDRFNSFVPRYIKRAIRYEDAMAILQDEEMPTKMDYDEAIGGKEAADYGPEFHTDDELSHEEKVVGQIRGYGRFLSATTSDRLATSTSRGTYDSPFGSVEIDLARMPRSGYTEARSEDAMDWIFDIDDLGQLEFIPKHLKGESATAKAGRDAFRAREIVVDSPPVNAVRTIPRQSDEKGIAIVGISGSATRESITAGLGPWGRKISFMEVNTNYKREIDDHEGRSAFVFFHDVEDIDRVVRYLRGQIAHGKSKDHKISDDAYVTTVPSSAMLNEHRNPEQRQNRDANRQSAQNVRRKLQGLADALGVAKKAKVTKNDQRFMYQVYQEVEHGLRELEVMIDQGEDPQVFNARRDALLLHGQTRQQQIHDSVDVKFHEDSKLKPLLDLNLG